MWRHEATCVRYAPHERILVCVCVCVCVCVVCVCACTQRCITFARCSSSFSFASVVSRILCSKAWSTTALCLSMSSRVWSSTPRTTPRRVDEALRSFSAFKMFWLEKFSHWLGVTDLDKWCNRRHNGHKSELKGVG